jgi:hypothetical protein
VKQPEILGIELEDNGDITARFLVEQKWTWSNAAARHLGVLLIRATGSQARACCGAGR